MAHDVDVERPWPDAPVLTPEQVRTRAFARTPLGRRGLDEDDVYDFLAYIADELARRDEREARVRANAERHKRALRTWSQEQAVAQASGSRHPAPMRPSVDVVNLMSRAQQDCDQRIRQTEAYCRQLTAEAERYATDLVGDAQRQAAASAEQAALDYRAQAGTDYSPEVEDLRRRLAWMATFIDSIGAAERQLGAVREALQHDVDALQRGTAP